MKKLLYILVLPLLTVALSSCRDMFNKMITYNGDEEPAVLCMNAEITVGQPLRVYLTRSYFFLDENRFVGNPNNRMGRRGMVTDATVEMRVNEGEWITLTAVLRPDTTYAGHKQEQPGYYTCDNHLRAGDVVTVRATHPDYKQVTATETVPAQPLFSVEQQEQIEDVLSYTLQMSGLPQKDGQVVFFYVTGFGHRTDTVFESHYDVYSDDYDPHYDTLVRHTPVVFNQLYSDNFMFSEYNLPRTTHGLYTQGGPLYTSADHFREAQQVTFLLDCFERKADFIGESETDTLGTGSATYENPAVERYHLYLDSVHINVYLTNESFYLYRTTLNGNRRSSYAPEISLYEDDSADDFGDIFGELSDIFSELGVQEGVQVYTNVENGYGHLSLLNRTSFRIHYSVELSGDEDY